MTAVEPPGVEPVKLAHPHGEIAQRPFDQETGVMLYVNVRFQPRA